MTTLVSPFNYDIATNLARDVFSSFTVDLKNEKGTFVIESPTKQRYFKREQTQKSEKKISASQKKKKIFIL